MIEDINREIIYFCYYFEVQLIQIFPYYVIGILIGSIVSVFGKDKIHSLMLTIQEEKLGIFGIIFASLIGIISPLCMYGTIPIAAAFSKKGMRDDYIAAFMMSSILLNPQLLVYSIALGNVVVSIRFISCFICGIVAGLLIRLCFKDKKFFNFDVFYETVNRDTDPNIIIRLIKNIIRNIKATGLWFLIGIVLSVLFQIGVPS